MIQWERDEKVLIFITSPYLKHKWIEFTSPSGCLWLCESETLKQTERSVSLTRIGMQGIFLQKKPQDSQNPAACIANLSGACGLSPKEPRDRSS
jgi:hypothetical protein